MEDVIDISERIAKKNSNRLTVRLPKRVADTAMRPFLAVASDDNLYWCKEIENPDGYESIINEVVASEVGTAVGAPIREWKILEVPEELDRVRIDGIKTLRRGPVFGSLDIHGGEVDIMDRGIDFIDRDGNYQRTPKLIALWLLCNACDLQVIFDHEDDSRIYSIDHGLWFGSENRMWELPPHDIRSGKVSIPGRKLPIPEIEWDKAIEKVRNLEKNQFGSIMDKFPTEWGVKESEVLKLIDYAVSRRDYTIGVLETIKQSPISRGS